MITKNITLNLQACLSGEPFSFDELIIETRELFENQGIPGFLKLLLSFTDKMVIAEFKASNSVNCCSSAYLIKNGKRSKNIYTSIGNIDFEWTTLKCKSCKKLHHPLKEFFDLGKFQKVSNEFEKICMETVAMESFRRSASTIKKHRSVDFNYRSLHRWFMSTESDEIKVTHSDLNVLMADGTGYKKFVSQAKLEKTNKLRQKLGKPEIEKTKRGEVKILMGIKDNNDIIPLGAWTSESWKVIGGLINKANNQNKKIAQKKVANILVADGEIGLNRGLDKLTHHQQRCLWHIPHELKPLMKYQDKACEEDIKHALNQVHLIFQIDIPEKDFDTVESEELVELNEKIKFCELQMKLLSEYLSHKGHSQAATYVSNARGNLFTYLKYWMKTGIFTQKVTSTLERLMRETNRRIKKFAFNWSEKGCVKITRILIKLITDPKSWENDWDHKLRLSANIRLNFLGVS
jgi:hypothetical protein